MPWFWTDDLADLLSEYQNADPDRLREWRLRPVGIAGDADTDPLRLAEQLAGIGRRAETIEGSP